MDTSKKYIEMCRKAVEIQELWKPKTGDFTDHGVHYPNLTNRFYLINYIWLPRQDQLQDISRPNRSKTAWAWNSEFTAFLNVFDIYDPIEKSNMSMEQLMLCFVMHEKYQKKWNGKDWERGLLSP